MVRENTGRSTTCGFGSTGGLSWIRSGAREGGGRVLHFPFVFVTTPCPLGFLCPGSTRGFLSATCPVLRRELQGRDEVHLALCLGLRGEEHAVSGEFAASARPGLGPLAPRGLFLVMGFWERRCRNTLTYTRETKPKKQQGRPGRGRR